MTQTQTLQAAQKLSLYITAAMAFAEELHSKANHTTTANLTAILRIAQETADELSAHLQKEPHRDQ
jgi:hypothetical protein